MKRDDLLLTWVKLFTKPDVVWCDIGAGDGSVSRAIAKIRPKGRYHCWDPAPRCSEVKRLSMSRIPIQDADFYLFNFVLHHVGVEEIVDSYIRRSFKQCRYALVIQEDLDDETPATQAKLREHEPKGFFLSLEGWEQKLKTLCPKHQVNFIQHPEMSTDTLGYHVPRGLFVVYR